MVGASENCPASSTTSRSRERRGIVPSFAKVHAVPPTTPPVPVSAHDDRNAETAALFFTGVHAAASSSSSVAPDFGTFTTRSAGTPARDHRRQEVLARRVGLADDPDAPAVLADEPSDDVRPDVGLARAGRALDRQVRPVEPEQRRDDRGDGVVPGDRSECTARRDPAEQVERGSGSIDGRASRTSWPHSAIASGCGFARGGAAGARATGKSWWGSPPPTGRLSFTRTSNASPFGRRPARPREPTRPSNPAPER